MNLIWAFDFGPEIDLKTEEPIPVNIFKYAKVCYFFLYGMASLKVHRKGCFDLPGTVHVHDHTQERTPRAYHQT